MVSMNDAWGVLPVTQERDDLLALLEELKEAGKKQLTVLLLGKAMGILIMHARITVK